MLKSVFFAVLLSSAQCLRANEDVVSNVTFSQDPSTLQVTIGYSRAGDESKIITLDVLTNGVSIGFSNIRAAVGDVNRLVQPGENKRILWRPDKSWPGWLLPQNEVQAVVIARSENDPPDYMMIDIALGSQSIPAAERTTYYEHPDQLPFPGGVTNEKCKTDYLVLRRCPAANMTSTTVIPSAASATMRSKAAG